MLFQEVKDVPRNADSTEFLHKNPSANEILCAIYFVGGTAPASAIYAKTQLGMFPDIIEFNRVLCGMVYVGILRMI